jgi:hypothetical protein
MQPYRQRALSRPVVALAAGLLAGLTVAVVLLAAIGSAAPDLAASASASAAASRSLEAAAPTFDQVAATERRIAEVESQVPPIRGLRPTRPVPTRIIDREQFKVELRALFDREGLGPRYRAAGDLYERLGLLPAGTDLERIALELTGAGVIGVYLPDEKQMIVIKSGSGLDATGRFTLAHEFTHALQDQHFGLERLGLDDPSQSDRGLARLALVEGDATQLMIEWAAAHLSPLELLSIVVGSLTPEQQQILESVPPILQRQTLFPYVQGQVYVAALEARGGWPAVDAAYDDPPDSTEQILHPAGTSTALTPIEVALPDLAASLGVGWTSSLEDTVGELISQVWLEQATAEGQSAAAAAAAGWGGDRIASLDGPSGSWAVAWQTAWDSRADAAEFRAGAASVLADLPGASALIADGGETVIVLLASDEATLDRLRAPFESL